MDNKSYVRDMLAFLNERHDMDCLELRKQFAIHYQMSDEDAKKIILELTMLHIFAEHFNIKI